MGMEGELGGGEVIMGRERRVGEDVDDIGGQREKEVERWL